MRRLFWLSLLSLAALGAAGRAAHATSGLQTVDVAGTIFNQFRQQAPNETITITTSNLSPGSADTVIHYDPWWNPAVEDQATDRAYRIGQTRNVFAYKLICKGTVEDKLVELQQRKRDLVAGVLGAESSLGKSLTREDLEELFSLDE